MKKMFFLTMFTIMMVSFVSATIILDRQPERLYNLGDTISIPVTIKSSTDVSGSFLMDLICSGHQINFYKNGVGLSAGEEKRLDTSLVLTKNLIGEVKGNCKIKGMFAGEYVLTDEFKISDLINIEITSEERKFAPGEEILIEGGALKENGKDVNGFVALEIIIDNSSTISKLGTINNGFFSIDISLEENMKAGEYLVRLNAYEKNFMEETTNQGFTSYNILIEQVPTNLEIVFENIKVDPGTNLKVKAVLHDQTGENIESNAIITVKDDKNIILEQVEKLTGEFFEFPIVYNEPPAEWTIVAVSNKITNNANFEIIEKEAVNIELINRTITITNSGNVFYNKSVSIKIGNESKEINVSLDVDEFQKYTLTAPNGEYEIKVMADGENKVEQSVMLTGKLISVKEASNNVFTLVRYPFVWIFIIAVMGFVAFIVFKKGYKRSFFRYVPSYFKKKDFNKPIPLKKNSLINSRNKAELSLSIKGSKQDVSVVCLKIKNLNEIESRKSNTEETLQEIVNFAEGKKAITYENRENLFFILAPIETKTFSNEKNTLEIARGIKEILDKHNRLAKQKIEFGISLNYGAIVARKEKDSLKFMSMGTLMTTAKKIASLSDKEIFLGEKMNNRLKMKVKTEKQEKEKTIYFIIKEIKNKDEHKKFLEGFVKRLEKK
jgi:hypothetical protein